MNVRKNILNIAFIIYISFLLIIVFFKFDYVGGYNGTYNITPLRTLRLYIENRHAFSRSVFYLNLLGNIAIFVPLGIFIKLYRPKLGYFPALLIVVLGSMLIEAVQYITKFGILDIDDVILNSIGGIIGLAMLKYISGMFGTFPET